MVTGKRTIYDLHNITKETKDRATGTPLQTEGDQMCHDRLNSSCSICGTCGVILVFNLK